MGRPAKPRNATQAKATGRYVQCASSGYLHPGHVFVQVMRKERHYGRCGCGTNTFLGAAWTDDMGLTYEQARAIPGAVVC